jgi:hypothetical protein
LRIEVWFGGQLRTALVEFLLEQTFRCNTLHAGCAG